MVNQFGLFVIRPKKTTSQFIMYSEYRANNLYVS